MTSAPSCAQKVRTFELLGALFDLFLKKLVFSLHLGVSSHRGGGGQGSYGQCLQLRRFFPRVSSLSDASAGLTKVHEVLAVGGTGYLGYLGRVEGGSRWRT